MDNTFNQSNGRIKNKDMFAVNILILIHQSFCKNVNFLNNKFPMCSLPTYQTDYLNRQFAPHKD